MSSSISVSVVTDFNTEQISPFMRLPQEVREMIYRPLLVARCSMMELNMTTKEYDSNRGRIQHGPDQTYTFHTAILATNRKIHEEARDLCRRENDFVCLTSREPSRLGHEIEDLGLQMIARESKARSFWNISLSLTLDPATLSGWPRARSRGYGDEQPEIISEDGRPWRYIFCSNELPEFCRILLRMSRADDSILQGTALYIDVNPAIVSGRATDIDDNPAGKVRMQGLLDPLRQLHSLGTVQIDGPLSGSYKGKVITSICKHVPTAMDIIHSTSAFLEQADERASKGQLRQANLEYKAALSLIRSCCWRYQEREIVMDSGPFPGLEALHVIYNLVVRLQARIAEVYLRSESLRMARIYTERALDPRRPYDDRHNKMYSLDIQPWQGVVFAEVLDVAAKISYTHGDVYEATLSLKEAGRLVPFNEEQQSRYEAWEIHAERLRVRRASREERKRLQRQKQIVKAEAMIQVVCSWKQKGDRLIRNGRSILAASAYQAALNKLDFVHRNCYIYFTIRAEAFKGYTASDAMNALTFKLQAGLAAAFLMSRRYTEVTQLTKSALQCSNSYCDCRNRPYDCRSRSRTYEQDWAEDQKLDCLKIHYCRALSLHHTGDAAHAVEQMEQAHSVDAGDGTVFAQLTILKQQLAAARKQRLEKLNSLQNQLRKKQATRRKKV